MPDQKPYLPFGTHNVLAVILGGGQGSRLFPLTKDRAKPAVPLGGKYRLVDIPISNCINSGFTRIFLLTQFNSASLHRHISQSYKSACRLPEESCPELDLHPGEELFLASMGIYVFNRQALFELLGETNHDFGKQVIPNALSSHRVFAYVFQGFWEDIGTIRSFFHCSLDMVASMPKFNLFDMRAPVFTRPRFLPASKINGGHFQNVLLSDGCIVNSARLEHSIIGLRSVIGRNTHLSRTIMMGNDFYESEESVRHHLERGTPAMGIGENTRIEDAIIDKNTRIGDGCVITPAGKQDQDSKLFYIREGIVVIPKNAVLPHGTVI